jgi:oxygen-independent coproporphyrinogen-3 oxidase
MGFWPGFTMAMYPSQFAYKKMAVDLTEIWGNTSELNLYYHIPFCKFKCPYCGFFSIAQNDDEFMMQYIDKLNGQALYYNRYFNNKINIKSICFGGGTPNHAPIKAYFNIFDTLSKMNIVFDKNIEPSMEISPEIINENYIRQLQHLGIKRLSLGVQSLDKKLRSTINRLNNYDLYQLIDLIRKHNINVNIDVINGLAGQTSEMFMNTLKALMTFMPETISIYPLAGNDSSMFDKVNNTMTNREKYILFDEFYEYLIDNGYYCESHIKFVKSNQTSTHQQKIYEYQGVETLGIGCAARSYNQYIHYSLEPTFNTCASYSLLQNYMKKSFEEYEWFGIKIDEYEQRSRFAIYGFLMNQLNIEQYNKKFNSCFEDDFKEAIESVTENGLVEKVSANQYILTRKGRTYTDLVCMQFWSKNVKNLYNENRGAL